MHTAGGNLDYGTGGGIDFDIELINGTVKNGVRFWKYQSYLNDCQKICDYLWACWVINQYEY